MHIRIALLALLLPATSCSSDDIECRTGALCQDSRTLIVDARPETVAAPREGGIADHPAPAPIDLASADRAADAPAPYQHEDVSVQTVNQWLTQGKAMTLLDVREPSEFQAGHLAGAINLPWNSGVLQQQVSSLGKTDPIVVYCASGNRSNTASSYLTAQGFRPIHDMLGGIAAWQAAGLPVVK